MTMTTQKIKEYKVIASRDAMKLQDEVKKLVQRGWQPYFDMKRIRGKLALTTMYIQPMVKYETNE